MKGQYVLPLPLVLRHPFFVNVFFDSGLGRMMESNVHCRRMKVLLQHLVQSESNPSGITFSYCSDGSYTTGTSNPRRRKNHEC